MKEYLHLFTPASEVECEKSYYLCFYVDRGINFVSESKVQQYEGAFYDYDGKTVTHVLDLSKLTPKARAFEVVVRSISDYVDHPVKLSESRENLIKSEL